MAICVESLTKEKGKGMEGKGMKPRSLRLFHQTRQFVKSSMGILPMSFPSTPVRHDTRSALTLTLHLCRMFP